MNEEQTKVDRSKIEEGVRVLEEAMKARYSEKTPSVLKPPEGVYRSYEVSPFWKKFKKNFPAKMRRAKYDMLTNCKTIAKYKNGCTG